MCLRTSRNPLPLRLAATTLPPLGRGPRGTYLPPELPRGSLVAGRPEAERSCRVPRCVAVPRASWLRSRAPHREIRMAGFKQKDPSSGVQVEGSGQPDPGRGIQAAGSRQKDPNSGILAAGFRQRDMSRRLQAAEFQNEVQAEESVQRGPSRGIRTEESGQSESGSRVEAAAPGGRAARRGSDQAAPRTGDGRVRRSRGRRASGGRGLGPELASERASRRKSERASEGE